ncbi:GNAT family N-acetyltransferase [Thermosporothrix hazakensis]|uniref:GNAT family N-acetyltransferase n=1 Tax=Thermosporothrix hazakensis TaxID=644383 RepID=UPI0014746503|nr:GNAT family N-acetyltransferase [Thermosporothrix hazakensis]
MIQNSCLLLKFDGQVIGHALFSPYQMPLLGPGGSHGQICTAAVDPAYQGRGVEGQLIAEGYKLLAAKEHLVSILLGHASYYPRFGYRPNAFGTAQVMVLLKELSSEMLDYT